MKISLRPRHKPAPLPLPLPLPLHVVCALLQGMVVGVPGKTMVNVLSHVEEVSRNRHVPVIVLHLIVMVMNVVVMTTEKFHVMNSAVQVSRQTVYNKHQIISIKQVTSKQVIIGWTSYMHTFPFN